MQGERRDVGVTDAFVICSCRCRAFPTICCGSCAASYVNAAPADIVAAPGGFAVVGVPSRSVTLAAVAAHAASEHDADGATTKLDARCVYEQDAATYPFAAHLAVVEVGHQRDIARRLQREPPAFDALLLRALAGGLDGARRQPGQASLVLDDVLEGVGCIQHVFRKFRGQLGQLDVDFRQPLFTGRIKLGAVAAKLIHRFLKKSRSSAP